MKGKQVMNDLVQRLSEQTQSVVVGGSQATLADFQKRVQEMGYVFIKFTQTRGGTDLGVRLDKQATDVSKADFAKGTGSVHLEGTLTLNYVRVRCVADIDLATLQGTGQLHVLEEVRP
jgi:hypothetical protein